METKSPPTFPAFTLPCSFTSIPGPDAESKATPQHDAATTILHSVEDEFMGTCCAWCFILFTSLLLCWRIEGAVNLSQEVSGNKSVLVFCCYFIAKLMQAGPVKC